MRSLTLLSSIAMPILLVSCIEPTATLSKEDLISFNVQLTEEMKSYIADWQARQASNLKSRIHEFPETSAEEIRREVSKGADYVISRISNGQPVLLLIGTTERPQPLEIWTVDDDDHVKVTPQTDSEFHLPYETYEISLSSASLPLQRKGREIALRWLYSRKIFPINISK